MGTCQQRLRRKIPVTHQCCDQEDSARRASDSFQVQQLQGALPCLNQKQRPLRWACFPCSIKITIDAFRRLSRELFVLDVCSLQFKLKFLRLPPSQVEASQIPTRPCSSTCTGVPTEGPAQNTPSMGSSIPWRYLYLPELLQSDSFWNNAVELDRFTCNLTTL